MRKIKRRRLQPFKLKLELVPEKLWRVNLRSKDVLGKDRWDKLRREIEPRRCAICGGTERLQGHEVWKCINRPQISVAKLVRVNLVCQKCHHVNHWGRTRQLVALGVMSRASYLALRRHFRTVNKCRQEDFDRHIDQSFAVWRSRRAREWRVDWGDFAPMIAEAEAARKKWASRNSGRDDRTMIGPGHHMPTTCPKCGTRNTLRMIE